jgi:hypothetical protein
MMCVTEKRMLDNALFRYMINNFIELCAMKFSQLISCISVEFIVILLESVCCSLSLSLSSTPSLSPSARVDIISITSPHCTCATELTPHMPLKIQSVGCELFRDREHHLIRKFQASSASPWYESEGRSSGWRQAAEV